MNHEQQCEEAEALKERVEVNLPEAVYSTLADYPGRVFLAGGSLRALQCGDEVSDWDLFVQPDINPVGIMSTIYEKAHKPYDAKASENAITGRIKEHGVEHTVQIITRWKFKCLREVLESFDFRMSQAGVVVARSGLLILDWMPGFFEDCAEKRLYYTSPDRTEDPAGSLLRIIKFSRKGWKAIDFCSLAKVVARAAKPAFTCPSGLYEDRIYEELCKANVGISSSAMPEAK